MVLQQMLLVGKVSMSPIGRAYWQEDHILATIVTVGSYDVKILNKKTAH